MNVNSDSRFITADRKYGVIVNEKGIKKILSLCDESSDIETGGILVGHYDKNHTWAVVTDISGPPDDSMRGHRSFDRGVGGLQDWLNHLWSSKRHYYLGEWHYHPFASAKASCTDIRQLKRHSRNTLLACPEPVMLIIGGDPRGRWEAKAYVYPRGKRLCDLQGNHFAQP